MGASSEFVAIPDPTAKDKPFKIGDVLTVYEAALVYAGRHPYPYFFDVKGRGIKEHLEFLRLGLAQSSPRKRVHAQRSWDIYCELINRIEKSRIQPVKLAYDQLGRIDLRRTQIRTSDLVTLAKERGEKPRTLRPLLVESPVLVEMPLAAQVPAPTTPITTPMNHAQIGAEYNQHVESFLRDQERYPTRQEDVEWGKSKKVKRDTVRELREKYIPAKVRRGGRPKEGKLGKK
jgi:hypothetical protein